MTVANFANITTSYGDRSLPELWVRQDSAELKAVKLCPGHGISLA